jgi:hypothetical protein
VAVSPSRRTLIAPLPCGRDAATAWDRAETGVRPDEHERDCPHCTAARADALGLHTVVHRMAAHDQRDLAPSPAVLDRVLTAVEDRPGIPSGMLVVPSPHGPARLARRAAAAVLRHTVDGMAGLRARSCRIEQSENQPLEVTITVAASYGVDLAAATARVRQMVMAAGEQALGLPVKRVDIEVVDLIVEEP